MTLETFALRAAVVAAVFLIPATAQTQGAFQDVAPALLTEVRALRLAIETVAAAGARGQLTLGRLQIQEQRVNAINSRLEATRQRMVELQNEAVEFESQRAKWEAELKNLPVANNAIPLGHYESNRASLEEMLTGSRTMLEKSADEMLRLTAAEASLAADLATEQARWADLNRRLEDIENRLSRKE